MTHEPTFMGKPIHFTTDVPRPGDIYCKGWDRMSDEEAARKFLDDNPTLAGDLIEAFHAGIEWERERAVALVRSKAGHVAEDATEYLAAEIEKGPPS